MNIYLVGQCFTQAEQNWNQSIMTALEQAGHKVWCAHKLLAPEILNTVGKNSRFVFNTCLEAINMTDCLVAMLDGVQLKDYVAWDIGYAYAKKIPVYGIRTDTRNHGLSKFSTTAHVVEQSLTGCAGSIEQLLNLLKTYCEI